MVSGGDVLLLSAEGWAFTEGRDGLLWMAEVGYRSGQRGGLYCGQRGGILLKAERWAIVEGR
jgi:hypothetical protein